MIRLCYCSAAVTSDHGRPRFWVLFSTICIWIFSLTRQEYHWVPGLINLPFVPKRLMPDHICVFRKVWTLSSWKPSLLFSLILRALRFLKCNGATPKWSIYEIRGPATSKMDPIRTWESWCEDAYLICRKRVVAVSAITKSGNTKDRKRSCVES